MIITLTGANFKDKNIGTLSTWNILTSLGNGATYSGVTSVDKDAAFSATVTIAEDYEVGSAGVKVTMGGTDITSTAVTTNEGTITISIASVTGTVYISVPTKNTATGEEDGGGDVEVPEGATLVTSGSLAGSYLYENYKFNGTAIGSYTGLAVDSSNTYFVYDKIPVTPGYNITIPKGRAFYYSKSDGSVLTGTAYQGNLTSSATAYTVAVPVTAAYITVCFKYADIQPSAVEMTAVPGFNYENPVTTLLKDTSATYMEETAIEKNQTEPTSYTGYYTYHLIPVTGGNKYKMENCRLSNWYDSSKTFISQVNFNINSANATTSDWSHVAPDNAAYLSVCVKVGDVAYDAVAMVEYPKA